MSTSRTDPHAPSNLVTEDYEYAYSYDAHPDSMNAAFVQAQVARLRDEGYSFGENPSAGGCFHCGAHIRYVAVLKHLPSRTLIKVGETCLDRFDLTTDDFHALRKRAELDRQAQRIKATRLRWFAINPDRAEAFAWASDRVAAGSYGWEGTRHSFVHKVNRYGETSDRFVSMILRDMVRTERYEEERAAREAAEVKAPVVEGQGVTITGEVVSVKFQDNDFGGRMVFTTKDDRGFLVWSSVPSTLSGVERGDRVSFVANVEKSDRDECFGFAKRPRKGAFLEEAVAA